MAMKFTCLILSPLNLVCCIKNTKLRLNETIRSSVIAYGEENKVLILYKKKTSRGLKKSFAGYMVYDNGS